MTRQLETLLKRERRPEAEIAADYLNKLSLRDKEEMYVFIQGMLFARNIDGYKEEALLQAEMR